MNARLLKGEALSLFKEETEYLSTGIASAVNLFGIDTVLLAGDLRYEGETTADEIEEAVKDRLLRPRAKPLSVIPVRWDENTKPASAAEIVFSRYLQI